VPDSGPPQAAIEIREPVSGSHFLLDPETPRRFQTLALKASVTPAVPEIVWVIDGAPQPAVPYPYVLRWPLEPGTHSFQARFPQAAVASRPVTVTVSDY
jgi:penicillin-binding protein 1C